MIRTTSSKSCEQLPERFEGGIDKTFPVKRAGAVGVQERALEVHAEDLGALFAVLHGAPDRVHVLPHDLERSRDRPWV